MAQTSQPGTRQWKQGTFECCSNCGDCLFAWCLPCIYDCMVTKEAGESTACQILAFCFPITLCCVRGNVREKKGIEGSAINDFLCVWCCHPCTATQLRNELKN